MAKTQALKDVELCLKKADLEQLLSDICHNAHKHEVQHWKDCPGTDDEKLRTILVLAREALAIVRDCTNA